MPKNVKLYCEHNHEQKKRMILRILLKLKKNLSILDTQYFLLKDLYI